MAQQQRIHWTTSQVTKVTERLADLMERYYPGFDWTEGYGTVGVNNLQKLLPEAQTILDKDFHRKYFSPKQLLTFSEDVTRILKERQLEKNKKALILADVPSKLLIEELATRMTHSVVELMLHKMRPEILERAAMETRSIVSKEVDRVKQLLRHDPMVQLTDIGQVELPTYAVIGLLKKQANILEQDYRGRCNFEFVLAEESYRIDSACKGKITFCMRFTDSSMFKRAKAVAVEAKMVNGTIGELKRLIDFELSQYNSLKLPN